MKSTAVPYNEKLHGKEAKKNVERQERKKQFSMTLPLPKYSSQDFFLYLESSNLGAWYLCLHDLRWLRYMQLVFTFPMYFTLSVLLFFLQLALRSLSCCVSVYLPPVFP